MRQRLAPGGCGAALPLDLVLLGLQGGDVLLGRRQRGGGGLVRRVEVDLARVEPGHLASRARRTRACAAARAGLGRLPGGGQPADLVAGGGARGCAAR